MQANNSTKKTSPNIGLIILILAGIIAISAVGFALFRGTGSNSAVSGKTATIAPETTPEQAIAKLEARLKDNPDDIEGWQMLGWSFFQTNRFAEAATAYRKAVALSPDNGELWSSLGEALALGSDGKTMPKDAHDAFAKALAKNPNDPRAQYFMAVEKDLTGDHKGALDGWFALLKTTPAGAPWEADLRRTITQVATREKIDVSARLAAITPVPVIAPGVPAVATQGIAGPTRDQMAAASKLPPGQQEAMVRGMVDGLAARLAKSPRDADGWIKLMRSRMVLGADRDAKAALDTALKTFADDSKERARLTASAKELGVPGA